MKKCPNCDREFDDAMRFCQTDGTPLVDAAPPMDPYKTMVASPADIAAMIPPLESTPEPEREPEPPAEEVLDLPAADPKKTMYASEDEIRSAMAEVDSPLVDIPPASPEPAPPAFIAPPAEDAPPAFSKTTPPIPSPFDAKPEPAAPVFKAPEPEPPDFVQPDPPAPAFNPFNDPAPAAPIAQAEFTPPPAAQDQSWQNEPMQNPQYQPGSGLPAAGGQNQTLAIVSLVSGILGLTLCCGSFLPSLLALVLGFMAKGKATQNPGEYGGKGLATGAIITGALGLVGGIILWIVYVFYFAAIMATMPR